jgi:hypothetical protein
LSSTEATNEATSSAKFSTITDITTVSPFNKKVGAPIDGRLGDRWIANYKTKYGYNQFYLLNADTLKAIVNQPNCVGICFYYAKNPNNNNNTKIDILSVGVDGSRKKMQRLTVSCMQDIKSWVNISWATAQQWIANHTGSVDAHFFGSNTFTERLLQTPCKAIRVDFAIDDKNIPQLLLSNTCQDQVNLVKQYEDDSNRCPTDCPN